MTTTQTEREALESLDRKRMALPIIDQAEKGSLPAAIKLMCLDCTCWQRKEIRDCEIVRCPMYPHRPYQRLKGRNTDDPPRYQPRANGGIVTVRPPTCA
jgi:hypothetical protein